MNAALPVGAEMGNRRLHKIQGKEREKRTHHLQPDGAAGVFEAAKETPAGAPCGTPHINVLARGLPRSRIGIGRSGRLAGFNGGASGMSNTRTQHLSQPHLIHIFQSTR